MVTYKTDEQVEMMRTSARLVSKTLAEVAAHSRAAMNSAQALYLHSFVLSLFKQDYNGEFLLLIPYFDTYEMQGAWHVRSKSRGSDTHLAE